MIRLVDLLDTSKRALNAFRTMDAQGRAQFNLIRRRPSARSSAAETQFWARADVP